MTELPKNWARANLSNLADFVMGQAPPGSASNFEGDGTPFVKAGEFGIDRPVIREWTTKPLKMATADDVLICVVGATSGKLNLGADCAIGRSVAAIRPVNGLEQLYLYNFLKTKVEELRRGSTGTAQGVISKQMLSEINVPFAPHAEQRRIVAKVDGLTARTARARKDLDHIPTLMARYKQRVLELATSGELTADWRVRNDLPDPKVGELGDLATELKYGSSSKSLVEGKVPVLRMGNIQDGKLDWTDLKYTSDEVEIEKFRLAPGDVLFNRTNSPELVGKTALYNGEHEAIYAGYLIRVKCGPKLMPEFLTYCLNSPSGRAYSWDVKADGVSQSNINAKKLAAFTFPLPSMKEQAEIVQRIESSFTWLDRLSADHAAADRLLPKLDAAILEKAFRGELVLQDPNDEPASVLLARIEAERATAPKQKRGRKARIATAPREIRTMARNLHEALAEAAGWISAQDAFQRCGIGPGASTEEIEELYAELRSLDKDGKLETEAVNDKQGRKLHDRLRLKAA